MSIDLNLIRQLRDMTGAGVNDCKKALEEASNNLEEAVKILRKNGISKSLSKSSREVTEGWIGSYIHHNGKLASLVILKCETDFVARTDIFKDLAHSLAVQVVTSDPIYISRDDIPKEVLDKEIEMIKEDKNFGDKKKDVQEKMIEGKLERMYTEICFMDQPFYKDDKIKVSDVITEAISKTGENIKIQKFVRFELGS
jgi:elongation factor Ts